MSTTGQTHYAHVEKLYEVLESHAENNVFTGSKLDIYREAGMSMGNYSKLFFYLTEMGCIEQVQRGTRSRPSVIRLLMTPTEQAFNVVYVPSRYRRGINLTKGQTLDTMQEELESLKRRMPDIDLASWIISVEARLKQLEGG